MVEGANKAVNMGEWLGRQDGSVGAVQRSRVRQRRVQR